MSTTHRATAGPGAWAAVARAVDLVLELTKARITAFVSVSVLTGYVLFAKTIDTGVLLPIFGVFLLACGSAALNHVQEARLDALMRRTKDRPIPSGRIPRDWAAFIACAFMGAGFYLLASVDRHVFSILGLGLLAVVWYNGVYLLLKRITAFAVVPGALVGAIPPVIGWAAAGGVVTDVAILDVALFFLLWQIPHFWLLLLLYGEDYERAGFPTPRRHFRDGLLGPITFAWVLALAATGLALAPREGLRVPWNLMILAVSAWLVYSTVPILLRATEHKVVVQAFLRINAYALAIMLVLMAHALIAV